MEFSSGTMASAAKARSLHEAISPYEQAQQPSQVDIEYVSRVSFKCQHLWVLRSIICIEFEFEFEFRSFIDLNN